MNASKRNTKHKDRKAKNTVIVRYKRSTLEQPIVTIMAQLITTKEKYGVSVAARIDPELAHQISERAERLGLSFAKMVAMLITKGFNPSEPIYIETKEDTERLEERVSELELELSETNQTMEDQRSLYKETAAKFIEEISSDQAEQVHFAQTYNQILSDLKSRS